LLVRNIYLLIVAALFLAGCTEQEQVRTNSSAPVVINTTGYQVPADSLAPPVVISVDESKLKKVTAGKPVVVPTGLNISPAIVGKSVEVNHNLLTVITPGTDTFPLPRSVVAIDSPFVAGIPVPVIAKDAYIKEQNPQNFSSFSKLQGLTHGNIPAMLEDKFGNIWLATYGGGVSRYDGKSFTHFTDKQGLSNNSVLSIAEDSDGNLWFGTNGSGVSRYDGSNFTHFTLRHGLNNAIVNSIVQDRTGKLWFGTEGGGLSQYDGKNFIHFTTREGLSSNFVHCILEDKKGNLWIGTNGGGVSKYDGKSFTHFTEKDGLSSNKISSILEDKAGNLWFGTNGGGIIHYDGKRFTSYTDNNIFINYTAVGIVESRKGNLWIGSNGGGMFEFDGSNFIRYTENEGLSLNAVRSLMEDRSGNLWIGTWGLGVSRFDGKTFTYATVKEGLSHKVMCSIIEDKKGDIWLGTGGNGAMRYDGKHIYHFTKNQGLADNVALSVLEDSRGNLWFGSLSNGVSKYDGKSFTEYSKKDGLSGNDVRCIIEDRKGNLWFGINGGGVSKFDGKSFTQYTRAQGLSGNDVRSMMEDRAGNIWFGTFDGGVTKYDGNTFTHFTENEGLSNSGVLSIFEDETGIIYFGTNGGGAMLFDGKRLISLTEKEGLSNNVVQSMAEDASGNLWFGTRFGLSKLSKSERQKLAGLFSTNSDSLTQEFNVRFHSYAFDDGFIGIGVNGGKTMCGMKDGTLWIGANDRLTIYHPTGDMPDTLVPNIQLTGLALFSENIDWTGLKRNPDTTLVLGNGVSVGNFKFNGLSRWYNLPNELSLAYNNNYLTFSFIGITMNRPKRVRYQYILQGNDANWSTVTDRTEAPYGNLSPGTYTFKVKAMNSEGHWSQPLTYTFTVRPPWWQTWWAYAAYVIILVGSIGYYIRWRERELKARQRELEQTVEERTAEVKEEKKLVEVKNKEILDSIAYAKRIQSTILPSIRAFKANLDDSFVLYMPKDIVAGDFYWFERVKDDNRLFFAACDCTGHGVPGAMVSVVCHNALNKALYEFGRRTPAEILDKTSELVIDNFNKNMELNDEVKDGMDASVCAFDPETGQLIWAGANNPLMLIRNGQQVTELKADKQHVGRSDNRRTYTNHTFQLEKGELIYLITDGFADQFGGANNKKFQKAKLRELLFSIHHLPMEQQRSTLLETFEKWRGTNEQVDDVTIIGVRV
jgi:ligand-binding sensor domain-containing protein